MCSFVPIQLPTDRLVFYYILCFAFNYKFLHYFFSQFLSIAREGSVDSNLQNNIVIK